MQFTVATVTQHDKVGYVVIQSIFIDMMNDQLCLRGGTVSTSAREAPKSFVSIGIFSVLESSAHCVVFVSRIAAFSGAIFSALGSAWGKLKGVATESANLGDSLFGSAEIRAVPRTVHRSTTSKPIRGYLEWFRTLWTCMTDLFGLEGLFAPAVTKKVLETLQLPGRNVNGSFAMITGSHNRRYDSPQKEVFAT